MKKISMILALLMCAALIVAAFAGCSKKVNTDHSDTEISGSSYDGSAVTIKFDHTMGANLREKLDIAIAEFNKLYPNITIEYTQVGNYDDLHDQIKTQIVAGNQPNVAYCYPDHVASYIDSNAVQPLDALIESKVELTRADGTTEITGLTDAQKADFIEGYYNEGKVYGDDKMYTLPFSKSTEVLYYNKNFFNEHNLTVPKTWEEMYEVCKKIKEIDPKCIPLGYDSEANWFITMCEQYETPYTSANEPHYLFDNEKNYDFCEYFNKWYNETLVTTQSLYGKYTSNLFTDMGCYMCIGSSAGSNYQKPDSTDNEYPFDVGIAAIPQVNPEKPKVISQGPSVCIFKKENIQEVYASWLFVKYLTTSVAFQADFSRASGYMPVIKSVADDEVFSSFLAKAEKGNNFIAAQAIKVSLENVDAYFVSPAFDGSSKARTEVGYLLTKCLNFTGNDIRGQIKSAFANAKSNCEAFS